MSVAPHLHPHEIRELLVSSGDEITISTSPINIGGNVIIPTQQVQRLNLYNALNSVNFLSSKRHHLTYGYYIEFSGFLRNRDLIVGNETTLPTATRFPIRSIGFRAFYNETIDDIFQKGESLLTFVFFYFLEFKREYVFY